MAKEKFKYKCGYCGASVYKANDICANCKNKKRIMRGWRWLLNGKEIIKEKKVK